MRVPGGFEHSLPEDEVYFAAFPHAQAYPGIHWRADRAFAHGILAWPLGRGDQPDRDSPAQPRHRIGVSVGFFGQFGNRGHIA
jgi:hypothetical protein